MMTFNKVASLILCCFFALAFSGCRTSLSTQYGLSDGVDAKYSPASVSLFRNLINANGRSTMAIRSMSPRAMTRLKAIVWSPDSFEPHQGETLAWIDRWLSLGERTLVYVGRDFSSTADYWSMSSEILSRNSVTQLSSLVAKEQKAVELAALDRMRAHVRSKVATPWFVFDHSPGAEERVTDLTGPWSESTDVSKSRLFIRSYPVPYDAETLATLVAELDWEPVVDTSAKVVNANAYDRKWQDSDANMLKTVKSLSQESVPEMEVLLSTQNNTPLVTEIVASRWGSSRVIVLTNASMISNLALINEGNLSIAKKLIDTLPMQNIGFLTGSNDPPVRKDDFSSQQKGFEMLTMWPLNVISLHAVFLGMLVLLAAFPIFGRAKQLPSKSTREFSQHIEAAGGLLSKSQDRSYALATIAEYFRNVRKEPTSPWANLDPMNQQEPQSPFKKWTRE